LSTIHRRIKMAKEKKEKRVRARTAKGKFIADDPNTPENEAYVKPKKKKVIRKVKKSGVVKLKPPTKEEAYKKHIKEATKKSQKEYKDFFIIAWIKKLMGVFNGSNK
tara:strand:- start:184 stop:504 length:321 start_codon:yes stop_codon:yes gene_type:complete